MSQMDFDVLDSLYSKGVKPEDFQFNNLPLPPPIFSMFTLQDIETLRKTAMSLKLSGNITKKYKIIDDIMKARGFTKFHSGTNRVVYRANNTDDYVVKIALDRVGITDNPKEFKNQLLLGPFVTRVFEVTPCGVLATVERVKPLIRVDEFNSVAEDIFELLVRKIIGRYILEDIGTDFYMNYGLRKGFGPVLLDYPYVYELGDGDKLVCNLIIDNQPCKGLIDYDDGFNNLVCTKCGKKYNAVDLQKEEANGGMSIIKGGRKMKVIITKGDKIIKRDATNVLEKPKKNNMRQSSSPENFQFKVVVNGGRIMDNKTGEKFENPVIPENMEMKEEYAFTPNKPIKEVKEYIPVENIEYNKDALTPEEIHAIQVEKARGIIDGGGSVEDIAKIIEEDVKTPEEEIIEKLDEQEEYEDKYGHLAEDDDPRSKY